MNSTPDPRREKEIFEQALNLASAREREEFLQQSCGAEPALLARLRDLLHAFDQTDGFPAERAEVQAPKASMGGRKGLQGAGGHGPPVAEKPAGEASLLPMTEKVGDRLGRYQLLEKIGEGGCGTVYMAEQLEPVRRRVALKIVKLGMDSNQVIARFEAERQALAVMEHPNIARVFDAGATDTGRPYFVMELVSGTRITQFCSERQLSLRERLELFVQVCRAIHHAHQKGVIHRDIKPSNILVTLSDPDRSGVPKVIDFGIAKATAGSLTGQTLFTRLEQFLGTPTYMSPEQADVPGVDVDTRSDIYSLGVVLYELLTGGTPFDSKALLEQGIEELILTLREVEPPSPSRRLGALAPVELETVARSRRSEPSKLVQGMRGDLDCIVMKCLEKDRARRYDTANALAIDIERHLANEPIAARPPSRAYRLQKSLRRNKLAFAAGALLALALTVGIAAVMLVQQRANQRYRQRFYAYQMGRAGAAVTAGQFDQLGAALEQCPPEHRHWEWSYLKTQMDRWRQRAVFKIDQPVRKLIISRNGDLVALMAGEQMGKVYLHQFPSGQRLSTIEMVTSMWAPLALHPGGGMLAGIPNEDPRVVQVWNTRTGELARSFSREDPIACLTFSPDGRLLAAGGGQFQVSCWEIATGLPHEPALRIHQSTALAFMADSHKLAVGTSEGEIYLLDAVSGKTLDRLKAGQGRVEVLAFSPDGKKLASTQQHPALQRSSTKLWTLADGSSKDLGIAGQRNTQFSPDGGWILSGSATFWDSASGEILGRLRLDDLNFGMATAFHPNGAIVSAGPGGTVILATPNRPAFERLEGHHASLRVLRFSPNGRTAASAGLEPEVRLWDVAAARELKTYAGHTDGVCALAWSPNAQSVVSASFAKELHCWDPVTLRPRWTNTLSAIDDAEVWWLEFSPDGKRVLSGSENGTLGLWDSSTGASVGRHTVTNTGTPMDGAAWSPDGSRIAGLFKDHVSVWKVDGWQVQWSAQAAADRCVRFSSDARWVVYGNIDGSVSLHDATDGRLVRSFERHQSTVKAVAFSPDNRRLFSGGADGTVRIWDTHTGDELLQLRVTGDRLVWSIDLSPDGRALAAADSDGVVTIWKTGATAPTRGHPFSISSAYVPE
jgi:eukaryotic-like serine/threonine-protein kinase